VGFLLRQYCSWPPKVYQFLGSSCLQCSLFHPQSLQILPFLSSNIRSEPQYPKLENQSSQLHSIINRQRRIQILISLGYRKDIFLRSVISFFQNPKAVLLEKSIISVHVHINRGVAYLLLNTRDPLQTISQSHLFGNL
jgi:hypothetical protein